MGVFQKEDVPQRAERMQTAASVGIWSVKKRKEKKASLPCVAHDDDDDDDDH